MLSKCHRFHQGLSVGIVEFGNFFTLSKSNYLYSDCLRRESNFLASTHRVTALQVCVCLLHCMRVQLQIMQHTHTHKAVTKHFEAKKLLSRQRQLNYRWVLNKTKAAMMNHHGD